LELSVDLNPNCLSISSLARRHSVECKWHYLCWGPSALRSKGWSHEVAKQACGQWQTLCCSHPLLTVAWVYGSQQLLMMWASWASSSPCPGVGYSNQSFEPEAQTPGIPHVGSSHLVAFKGVLLHGLGHITRRGKVSSQPIFSHLWGTDMRLSFK
jgi:hypothetical protein